MQRTRKRKLESKPKNRKNTSARKKAAVSGGNLSARTRRKKSKPTTGGFTSTSLLGFKVPTVSAFRIDNDSVYEGEGTEAHGLNLGLAIPLLYKCLKQNPKFSDDKQWDEVPTQVEFMHYLVDEVKTLAGPKDWYFGKLQNDQVGLVIYSEYPKFCEMNRLSLEWLIDLKKQNYDMYLTAKCMLSKIAEAAQMEVIYTRFNDYFFECMDANLIGEDSDQLIIQDMQAYLFRGSGLVYEFYQEFVKAKEMWSYEGLAKQIETLKLRSDKQIRFANWMQLGLEFLAEPITISELNSSIYKEYNDGEQINVHQMFGMVYSYFDTVFEHEESYINDHESNFGSVGPYIEHIFMPSKKLVKPTALQSLEKLFQFCKAGQEFFDRYYRYSLSKKYDKRRKLIIEC